MKISLFAKPFIFKVFSFIIIFISIASTPLFADASFLSDILGTQADADEVQIVSGTDTNTSCSNSQNMSLSISSESSVNPDVKTVSSDKDLTIEDNSLLCNEDVYVPDASFERSPISDQIIIYTVESGDTLSEIAETFDISVNTIRWENNISGQTISIGQKLNILPVTGVKHIVKSGDTISGIAKKYDADTDDILIFNGISASDTLQKGQVVFVPNGVIQTTYSSSSSSSKSSYSTKTAPSGYYLRPATGPITSPYGPRKGSFHYGVDIGNNRGTSIVVAADGVVAQAVSYCKEGSDSCGGRYGNYVTIKHDNGQSTRYAHLQTINVSVGQKVTQGQKIATMGNTGHSTGPHLHFEIINSNGTTVKPPF